jgi:O-antigen ligase
MSFLGKLIATALFAVSVCVLTTGTDPVNVPKLFLLGVFSFASIGAVIHPRFRPLRANIRIPLLLVGAFNLASILSVLNSKAPVSQSLFGVYGRNNGYLLYLFLSLIFVACLSLATPGDFRAVLIALFAVGLVNVIYAFWVMGFGDFIPWNNPYGSLLGTFGNPNFAGSFFGILSAVPFSYLFNQKSSWKLRALSLSFLFLIFIGIIETNAVQGKVLFVFSFIFVCFFAVRSRHSGKLTVGGYLILSSIAGIYSLLGAFQVGPLTNLIYKESVSLRGQYWFAGWKTGITHPFFGVGFDSYGDWYRSSRRESSLIRPGIDTVSNTAHNVYIDIFSFGGFPLLLTYSAITLYIVIQLFKKFRDDKSFDPIFIALSTAWLSYQLQSLISINQVGLAMWGWVLGAALISYSRMKPSSVLASETFKRNSAKRAQTSVISPALSSALVGLIGLLIALPPLRSDLVWKSALDSRDATKVEKALVPNLFNPVSTNRYNSAVALFETSNLKELAHKYALLGVEFNPNNYDAWKNLYQIENTTGSEKAKALERMKMLDPKNPNLKATS